MIALWLALSLFCGVPLFAGWPLGDVEVTAEGVGPNENDALLQAKRNAVEEGLGTLLVSETEIKNFVLQKDVILTKTVGAVKQVNVLASEKRENGGHRVRINAVVSMASIRDDLMALKILLESMDRPRMMVAIREQGGTSAQTAIVDYLKEKAFELVDPATMAARMQKDDDIVRNATLGDPVAAARIGAENGAEYAIVGAVEKRVMKSDVLGNTGMKSGQAVITAKVVNCSSAQIVASKSARSASVHVSEAVAMDAAAEKAAKKLMDRELFEKIVASFQDMVNQGIDLSVTIEGVADYKVQQSVSGVIAGIDGVVDTRKRAFGGGRLELAVQFKGNADVFADAADGISVGEKNLSVTGVTGSNVTMLLSGP
jgi:hypothetical protein